MAGAEGQEEAEAAAHAAEALIAKRRFRFRFMQHTAWENALFVHWPVDPSIVAKQLPKGLEPDILEGMAWVGLVLLTERGVSAHHPVLRLLLPPIDHLGANVRTYVRRNGVPGIYFWSLECSSLLASFGARLAGIPYFPAQMRRLVDVGDDKRRCQAAEPGQGQDEDGVFEFASSRRRCRAAPLEVTARWRLDRLNEPVATTAMPANAGEPNTTFWARGRWFVERYSVFAAWPWGRGPLLLRGDIRHGPWPLQRATLEELHAEALFEAAGLGGVTGEEPHVCFSRGVGPIDFWMLEPV